MVRAPMGDEIGSLYRGIIRGVRPVLMATTRREWSGTQYLPRSGGVVIAANHLSYVDPFTLAHFLVDNGRAPSFLAKSGLFDLPVAGQILHRVGQIPVYRNSSRAIDAFSAAVQAVRDGKCVVVLPEGTLTTDPQLWPMAGKTGAARIALETGCPLIPVATWGPQAILWPYRGRIPRLLPRKTMQLAAGPPVDLSDLRRPYDAATLREATDRLMDAIEGLLAGLRGSSRPGAELDEAPPREPTDLSHPPQREERT